MKRLVILSDINGMFFPEERLASLEPLKQFDAIDQLDAGVLARIESDTDKDIRHQKFIAGGIDVAVETLIAHYPHGIDTALGLSIGGVILWRAVLKGLQVDKLVCFSSTRLRFEKQAPPGDIRLYFGETDRYQPPTEWFETLGQRLNLVSGLGHDFYRASIGLEIFHRELQENKRQGL
jgi:hypothetical protein